MWNQYKETGDVKLLNQFKAYCKNDVRMTALVMFYFLHYKRFFLDGNEYTFSLKEFVEKSNNLTADEEHSAQGVQNQSIF